VAAEPAKSEATGAFKAEDGKFLDVTDLLKVVLNFLGMSDVGEAEMNKDLLAGQR
jgi:hypothetical protein